MELVDVTLSPVQRRAGVARVPWTELATQQKRRGEPVRALAPGDDVVLHVDGHTFHRGRVLSNLVTRGDAAYVITIGAPMGRRFGSRPAGEAEPVVQDVEVRVVPAQREARRVSLYL